MKRAFVLRPILPRPLSTSAEGEGQPIGFWRMTLAAATLLLLAGHAGAEAPQFRTVGELRALAKASGEWGGAIWAALAFGAIRGVESVGHACDQRTTAGELAAHLELTAHSQEQVSEVLGAFFRSRGCGPVGPVDRPPAAELILAVRQATDEGALSDFVRRGGGPGADPMDRALGVVAGARLLELHSGLCEPRAPAGDRSSGRRSQP